MNNFLKVALNLALAFILVVAFTSCSGGGTTGTGVTEVLVEGRILDEDGQGAANILISVKDGEASDLTDANGQFTIEIVSSENEIILELISLDSESSNQEIQTITLPDLGQESEQGSENDAQNVAAVELSILLDKNGEFKLN
jgi:hypothetical protein